ncbi:MAG: hypothetical protein ABTQ29_01000 [Siculibacillus sp.]
MSVGFKPGEAVSYFEQREARPRRVTIVRVMPTGNDGRTYRIRDNAEGFERAVPESALARIAPTAASRVFDS